MKFACVADFECELGEGPIWHPDEQRLYWVDITTGRLLRYDPEMDSSRCVHQTDVISGLTIHQDGSLLLFLDRGKIARWEESNQTVSTIVPSEMDTRFNHVIADPSGRAFCGTIPVANRGGRL